MQDERITRIARALCRSARIDPDSPLIDDRLLNGEASTDIIKFEVADGTQPAWTMFRGAALTFIHSHDDRVVARL
ncbi:hypothetical protein [Bosea sp. Root381]|uniref:hypothetical protein n=1 Tax=Bosea sp. Root381 TaxID=1736524 RepID=UPI0006F3D07A|nr:hypothetical protein [Bosea sp. Root381]